jgi:hypothetical protein
VVKVLSVLIVALSTAVATATAASVITLSIDPRVVTVGSGDNAVIAVSGSVPSGREGVDLVFEAKECDAPSFVPVHTAQTGQAGAFRAQLVPVISTTYRVRAGNTVSAPVGVLVRPGVVRFEQNSASRYEVHIIARRFFGGAKGQFERFNKSTGKWVLVRRVTLARENGPRGASMVFTGAAFKARVPKGTLVRFVLPRSQVGRCYLAGYSRIFNTWT